MRHLALGLTALLALAAIPVTAAAQKADETVRVAYVDLQRALLEVEDGKKAKKQLETMKADRQKELDALQTEVRKLKEDFDRQAEFMKPDVRQQKQIELAQKLQQLQQTYAEKQKELVSEEAKLTQKIFARMGRILAKVGESQGFTMIFEKTESSLLWAPRHLDLTDELIRRYNAGEGKQEK
ncbi:MAG: OmpH family outer membrane protein [bacterium]|nr:OmpH family outer membrane protein [Myxococcales bacterium]MCB9542698.1 OmpH family outer membrane protein [Myxococcales bacterium]MCB9552850.1 OmpH family outer membrane protein [Myxococcales bacterium]